MTIEWPYLADGYLLEILTSILFKEWRPTIFNLVSSLSIIRRNESQTGRRRHRKSKTQIKVLLVNCLGSKNNLLFLSWYLLRIFNRSTSNKFGMDCINSLLQAASAEHFFSTYDAVSSQMGNIVSYQNSRPQCEEITSMSQTVPSVEDINGYADAMQFPDDLSAFGEFKCCFLIQFSHLGRKLFSRFYLSFEAWSNIIRVTDMLYIFYVQLVCFEFLRLRNVSRPRCLFNRTVVTAISPNESLMAHVFLCETVSFWCWSSEKLSILALESTTPENNLFSS